MMRRGNSFARGLGFTGYHDLHRRGGDRAAHVAGRADFDRLPPRAQETRRLTFSIISEARREELRDVPPAMRYSLDEIARREHVPIDVVRFWGQGAVTERNGRLVPIAADREWRLMRIASQGRLVEIEVRGSRAATGVSRYWEAVATFRDTQDESVLAPFRGGRIAGHELETDPDTLNAMDDVGLLSTGPYPD
jgi:hypothetical protein